MNHTRERFPFDRSETGQRQSTRPSDLLKKVIVAEVTKAANWCAHKAIRTGDARIHRRSRSMRQLLDTIHELSPAHGGFQLILHAYRRDEFVSDDWLQAQGIAAVIARILTSQEFDRFNTGEAEDFLATIAAQLLSH